MGKSPLGGEYRHGRFSAIATRQSKPYSPPAVLINGARQVGKSTLAKVLMLPGSRYETLDAALTFAAASSSPEDFVEGLGDKVVTDEIQCVSELLLAI